MVYLSILGYEGAVIKYATEGVGGARSDFEIVFKQILPHALPKCPCDIFSSSLGKYSCLPRENDCQYSTYRK